SPLPSREREQSAQLIGVVHGQSPSPLAGEGLGRGGAELQPNTGTTMNTEYRERLPGTDLDYYNAPAAVDAIKPGAWAGLPYTSRVLAEQLVRRCDPATLTDSLQQLIERKRDLDFPWYPARVVCHDILGQTALVDLAGLRDAIAEQGGDPALVNPVVPTQLIVDHSLAVE